MRVSVFIACFLLSSGLITVSKAAGLVPEPDVVVSPAGPHIVINVPQARVFLYEKGRQLKSWPAVVGKQLTQTPSGQFTITGIYHNPTWHVPRSIQRELRAKGKPVQTMVPPGKENPIGKVFIRFGEPALSLGIHGTNAPSSIPGFLSHGCVRMRNNDILELTKWIELDTPVSVVYQTVLLSSDSLENLWLTVYPDPYQRSDLPSLPLHQTLFEWERAHQQSIDTKRINKALAKREGKPICLTCNERPANAGVPALVSVPWLTLPGQATLSPGIELGKRNDKQRSPHPVTEPHHTSEQALPEPESESTPNVDLELDLPQRSEGTVLQ